MTTTFEQYAGQRARNYSTLPTIDVEVLEPVMDRCHCGEPIEEMARFPYQRHVDRTLDRLHVGAPTIACTFCGCQDPVLVKFRHQAWSDEVGCRRCGGVDGWAVGD